MFLVVKCVRCNFSEGETPWEAELPLCDDRTQAPSFPRTAVGTEDPGGCSSLSLSFFIPTRFSQIMAEGK